LAADHHLKTFRHLEVPPKFRSAAQVLFGLMYQVSKYIILKFLSKTVTLRARIRTAPNPGSHVAALSSLCAAHRHFAHPFVLKETETPVSSPCTRVA
jgi:hypothetical protein